VGEIVHFGQRKAEHLYAKQEEAVYQEIFSDPDKNLQLLKEAVDSLDPLDDAGRIVLMYWDNFLNDD